MMTYRIALTVGLLLSGLAGQVGFRRHLESAGPPEPAALEQALAELPREIGGWTGRDREIEDERHLYGDDHLQRDYRRADGKQGLSLWMVYSGDGSDRGHHPEVCMKVAGHAEDTTARQTLFVGEHPEPIQQYRFNRGGETQWIYYWYYTLPFDSDGSLDEFQTAYRDLRHRPASLTVEVFAPEKDEEHAEQARQFVAALDEALQRHLGPSAKRGSRRLPVTVVNR